MAFTLAQHTSALIASGTRAHTKAYASNVTAGNLLVVIDIDYAVPGSGSITTPISNTGTAGVQTWHQAVLFDSSTDTAWLGMWYATASGTGTCTPSQTWDATTSGGEFYVSEWSGTSVVGATQDGTGKTSDGTTASVVLPSITTTNPDDLVIGYASTANTATVVSPWVTGDTQSGDHWFYQVDLAAGTYTPHVTQTSGTYGCVMCAFGAAGTATGIPDLTMAPPHR